MSRVRGKRTWPQSLVALALLLQGTVMLPAPIAGAAEPAIRPPAEPTAEGVAGLAVPQLTEEEAVARVREMVPVPEGWESEARLVEGEPEPFWMLQWQYRADRGWGYVPDRAFLRARVDAVSGQLLSLEYAPRLDEPAPPVGQWLDRPAAAARAREVLSRFAPDLNLAHLQPGVEPLDYGGNLLDPTYGFVWQRIEDGIPVKGDRVTIRISARDGGVRSFSRSWHAAAPLPPAETSITPDVVRERVVKQLGLVPVYARNWGANLVPGPGGGRRLVVQPNLQPGLALDVATGEWVDASGRPVPEPRRFVDVSGLWQSTTAGEGAVPRRERPVTEKEAKAIAREALDRLDLAPGWEARAGGWGESYQDGHVQRILHVTFLPPESGPSNGLVAPGHIQVGVTEATGEVESLNVWPGQAPRPEGGAAAGESPAPLDWAAAAQRARELVAVLAGPKAQALALEAPSAAVQLQLESLNSYRFTFVRVHQGAVVEGQGADITLNALDGSLRDYRLKWYPLELSDEPFGLDQKALTTPFRESLPVELVYWLLSDPRNYGLPTGEVRLVYQLGNLDGHYLWEVASAAWINHHGRPPGAQEPSTNRFAGHWAEKVLAVAEAGGLIPPDLAFDPDSPVSRGTAVRWLVSILRYRPAASEPPAFADVPATHPEAAAVSLADQLGWLEESERFAPDAPATRAQVAIWLSRAAGYDRLLAMPNRIGSRTPDLPAGEAGQAMALAEGLGWIQGDATGRLRPDAPISYAELATVILRAAPDLRQP